MIRRLKASSSRQGHHLYERRYLDLVRRLDAAAIVKYGIPASPRRSSLLVKLEGTDPLEGIQIVRRLHEALPLGGDVCEFGVAQGRTSALLADEILLSGAAAALHLFDSFVGLPAPSREDELLDDIFALGTIEAYEGRMSVSETEVKTRMDECGFKNYTIWKGFINENTTVPRCISFAYLDMDFFEPTLLGLRLVWPALVSGATVMVDDYGFFSSGVERAVRVFCQEVPNVQVEASSAGAGPFVVLSKC